MTGWIVVLILIAMLGMEESRRIALWIIFIGFIALLAYITDTPPYAGRASDY